MKDFLIVMKKDWKSILKRILFLISIILTSEIYVLLNSYRGRVYHIPTSIDNAIPFSKYFIVFYVFWYVYLGASFTYYIVRDESRYFKLLWGINMGMLVCFGVYLLFPTVVPRPEVYGNDIFAQAVRIIYGRDNPYNCFPSIHVFDSFLIAIYVNRDNRISKLVKILSSASAIMITLSTLYVKQHYFYDAVSGAALAYIIYFAFNYRAVVAKYLQKNPIMPTIKEEQV